MKMHHFWQFVKLPREDKRRIIISRIATTEQHADMLTKGLVRTVFEACRKKVLGW